MKQKGVVGLNMAEMVVEAPNCCDLQKAVGNSDFDVIKS